MRLPKLVSQVKWATRGASKHILGRNMKCALSSVEAIYPGVGPKGYLSRIVCMRLTGRTFHVYNT